MEDRKINHPSSLAFLPTFIPVRTTIGRSSRPPLRTNVAAARSKLILLFSLFIGEPRFSSSLGFLRIPWLARPRLHVRRQRIRSVFKHGHRHPLRFLRICSDGSGPYTMLNCENINDPVNNRSPTCNYRRFRSELFVSAISTRLWLNKRSSTLNF